MKANMLITATPSTIYLWYRVSIYIEVLRNTWTPPRWSETVLSESVKTKHNKDSIWCTVHTRAEESPNTH